MKEVFKLINGFNGMYSVSNLGNVRNEFKDIQLKPRNTGKGYMIVTLYKQGKPKHYKVHRLVMSAFVGESKLQVDHINGNRGDNRLENLRYCTPRQNKVFSVSKVNTTSKYNGVCARKEKWISSCTINGKPKYLGTFNCEFAAHVAYVRATK